MMRRTLSIVFAIVLSVVAVVPTSSVANAQQLAQGFALAGDFKGVGNQQIASLYDPNDDLGLRIVVLDRGAESRLVSAQWFLEGANKFDMGRMKPVALDLNADGKTDIAVLYNDGNLTVHLVVWLSTGTSFAYQGNQGWWRHTNFDWNRARDLLPGLYNLATNKPGIVIPYILDNYQLKMLYQRPSPASRVPLSGPDPPGTFPHRGGGSGGCPGPAGFFDITKARFGA